MKKATKAFDIKAHSCDCKKPKVTNLEVTHGNTVDAWAYDLCLKCYLKKKQMADNNPRAAV